MYTKFKIKHGWRYLTRRRQFNVFHCCIQKTATQWFKGFFRRVSQEPGVSMLAMSGSNHIPRPWHGEEYLKAIPDGVIVSPLYIRPGDFLSLFGEREFRACFVMRDPRDIVVSDYFSLRDTHPIKNEYYAEWRHRLQGTEPEEGIAMRIREMEWNFYTPLREWSQTEHSQIRLVKYEDFFGDQQRDQAGALLEFLQLSLPGERLDLILDELSFKRKSRGRSEGQEDRQSHYRKGKPGDWRNHFNESMVKLFKEKTGDLLQVMGYESNDAWKL
jgi:hypothetical protein